MRPPIAAPVNPPRTAASAPLPPLMAKPHQTTRPSQAGLPLADKAPTVPLSGTPDILALRESDAANEKPSNIAAPASPPAGEDISRLPCPEPYIPFAGPGETTDNSSVASQLDYTPFPIVPAETVEPSLNDSGAHETPHEIEKIEGMEGVDSDGQGETDCAQAYDFNDERRERIDSAENCSGDHWGESICPDSCRETQAHEKVPDECEGDERRFDEEGLFGRGLLHYRKWWELSEADIRVNGDLVSGIAIFTDKNTLRVVNDAYSYFIPLEKIDYIRTTDGLRSSFTS